MRITYRILLFPWLWSMPVFAECHWALEPGKLGPLEVGMTIPQAERALAMPLILKGPVVAEDPIDFYYSPSACENAFLIIATSYNTDDKGTLLVAMIAAGTTKSHDGISVGDSEEDLRRTIKQHGHHVSYRKADHYDTEINAYAIASPNSEESHKLLVYFAPKGQVNAIVASWERFAFRVDIGRPEGQWWHSEPTQ